MNIFTKHKSDIAVWLIVATVAIFQKTTLCDFLTVRPVTGRPVVCHDGTETPPLGSVEPRPRCRGENQRRVDQPQRLYWESTHELPPRCEIARRERMTVHQLCTSIARTKPAALSLTVAIRCYALGYFCKDVTARSGIARG